MTLSIIDEFSLDMQRKMNNLAITYIRGTPYADHLYKVVAYTTNTVEMRAWCQSQFKDDWVWTAQLSIDRTIFYFKNEEDSMLFRLKYNIQKPVDVTV